MVDTQKEHVAAGNAAQSKPGDVIVPGGAPRQPEQRTVVLDKPKPVAGTIPNRHNRQPEKTTPSQVEASPKAPPPAPPPVPLKATEKPLAQTVAEEDDGSIRWTASEFVAHDKSAGWYFLIIVVALIVAGLVWLLTKDKISASVVIVGGLALAFYGARRPRQLEYKLSNQGLSIGSKYHSYDEFRSFGVVPEGHLSSVIFMPLRRFAPVRAIHFPAENEDQVVGLLTDILPFEEHVHDITDLLMRRIRF